MNTQRLFSAVTVLVMAMPLASCNSFNRIALVETNTSYQHWESRPGGLEGRKPIINEDGTPNATEVCPIYKLPAIPKTPELPIKELEKISPDDTEALDAIQRKHIEELRLHIMRVKAAMAKSQIEYLNNCKAYLQR